MYTLFECLYCPNVLKILGYLKTIIFPFGTNGKLMILGVPINGKVMVLGVQINGKLMVLVFQY